METLAPEDAAAGADTVAAGELVWARAKARQWWPARVLAAEGRDAHISYFGSGGVKRRPAAQLRRFSAAGADEIARRSRARVFVAAVEEALAHAAVLLRSELTCACSSPAPGGCGGGGLGVANLAPIEFLASLLDAAVDVSAVGLVDCARLKSWVAAFGVGWGPDGAGCYPRRAVEELVDKIDLDVPAGEEKDAEWVAAEEKEKKGLEGPQEEEPRWKKRSVAALMEELDIGLGEDEKKDEGFAGLGLSAKRERKKSKYLSPPYTNLAGLVLVQKAPDLPKMTVPDEEDEERGLPDNVSAEEVLLLLWGAGKDVFHGNWFAEAVKSFLGLYRSSVFVEGVNYEAYNAHKCEAENVFRRAGGAETPRLVSDASAVLKRGKCVLKRSGKKDSDGGNSSAIKRKKKQKLSPQAPLGCGVSITPAVPIRQVRAEDIRSQVKAGGGAKNVEIGVQGDKNKAVLVIPISATISRAIKQGEEQNQSNNGSIGDTLVAAVHAMPDQSAKRNVEGVLEAQKLDADIRVDTNAGSVIVNVPVRSELLPMDGRKHKPADGNEDHANVEERTIEESYASLKAMVPEMLRKVEVANGKNVIGMRHGFKGDGPKGNKPKKKKKAADGSNVNSSGETANGACPDVANSAHKKKKKISQHFGNPAALLLDFARGVVLPTREELLSAFGKFGFLIESETEIVKDTRSARIVFGKSAEAEAAYNSAETLGTFGPPFATPRLHYLPPIKLSAPPSPSPVSKPPLTDIRKNLEKMISSLKGPASLKKATSSDGMKPVTDNLVGEMQGLLVKVDKMLSGPSTSTPP